jgi:CRISPR-associated endoribonuclease Cas6
MRLLIKLRCIESGKYEMQYHYQLQGFIYNLIRGSMYDQIHNREGYKFFGFSNIFPAKDLRENDVRTLIISSLNSDFVEYLCGILQLSLSRGTQIKIGNMKFKIDSLRKLALRLPDMSPCSLITGTPIPKEKYKAYDSQTTKYDYIRDILESAHGLVLVICYYFVGTSLK